MPEPKLPLLIAVEHAMRQSTAQGATPLTVLRDALEELGEVAAAMAVEDGSKPHKQLAESAKNEAADAVVATVALFYSLGGLPAELEVIGRMKVRKWSANMARKSQ